MNNNFDYQTNTVDGARGFADMHAEPERCDYVPDEFEDESEDESEDYEEEYEDEEQQDNYITVTRDMAIDAQDMSLEGQQWRW